MRSSTIGYLPAGRLGIPDFGSGVEGSLKLIMFYVYVLRSTIKNWHYTGQTKNIKERLKQHNAGKNRSTKAYKPLELVYFEAFKTREEVVLRERFLK